MSFMFVHWEPSQLAEGYAFQRWDLEGRCLVMASLQCYLAPTYLKTYVFGFGVYTELLPVFQYLRCSSRVHHFQQPFEKLIGLGQLDIYEWVPRYFLWNFPLEMHLS